jgi:hypothetical protein
MRHLIRKLRRHIDPLAVVGFLVVVGSAAVITWAVIMLLRG